LRRDDRIV